MLTRWILIGGPVGHGRHLGRCGKGASLRRKTSEEERLSAVAGSPVGRRCAGMYPGLNSAPLQLAKAQGAACTRCRHCGRRTAASNC